MEKMALKPFPYYPTWFQRLLLALFLPFFDLWAGPGDGLFYFDDTKAGTSVLPYLKIPVGARAGGMGAFGGSAESEPMVYFWNPARIPLVEGYQGQFSHTEYLGEWRHEGASVILPAPYIGQLGIGFHGLFATPFEGARDMEEEPQDLRAMDYALGVAWGFEAWERRLYLGAKLNWLHSQLAYVKGDGYGIDVAASWAMPFGSWGSAVVQNVADGFSYRSGTDAQEKLPTLLRLGYGYSDTSSQWAWQFGYSKSNDAFQRLHAGLEWNWQSRYFMRSGYEWDLHNPELGWMRGLSLGAGLKISTLGIDYSIRSLGNLGLVHAITLQVRPPISYRERNDYLAMAQKAWEKGTCADAVKFAQKALRENPSELKAVAIMQACERETRVAKAQYIALAFMGNTEGQTLAFWEEDRSLGGLSRRKALLDRIRMQYPAVKVLDAGRMFSRDTANQNTERLMELYPQFPVDLVLLDSANANMVARKGWGNRLPWISTAPKLSLGVESKPWAILKENFREIAVFAFSSFDLARIRSEVDLARNVWERAPSMQVLLFDGSEAHAVQIANTIPGIDLIILSGEQALLARPLQIHKTWIASPGRRGEALGLALLWFDEGVEPRWDIRMMPVDETQRPDSLFAETLGEDWRGEYGENDKVVDPSLYDNFLYTQTVSDGVADLWMAMSNKGVGTRITRKPLQVLDAQMAWSRDRMFILADSSQDRSTLYLQDVSSKEMTAVRDSSLKNAWVKSARWEPYENWVYFVGIHGPSQTDLYRTTWKGTHLTNLSRGKLEELDHVEFAPDGHSMLMQIRRNTHWSIEHAGMTLAHREKVSPDSVEAIMPKFHPAGTQVAYLSRPQSASRVSWDLMLWDSRDDHFEVLGKDRAIHDFCWSIDGRQLFLEVGVNRRNIVVYDLESRKEFPLRTSFEDVLEEQNPRAHRLGNLDGILFESKSGATQKVLWMIPGKPETIREIVSSPSGAGLP